MFDSAAQLLLESFQTPPNQHLEFRRQDDEPKDAKQTEQEQILALMAPRSNHCEGLWKVNGSGGGCMAVVVGKEAHLMMLMPDFHAEIEHRAWIRG